jgi:hypothetical protein
MSDAGGSSGGAPVEGQTPREGSLRGAGSRQGTTAVTWLPPRPKPEAQAPGPRRLRLEEWCAVNLAGGFMVVPDRFRSAELVRTPRRTKGMVFFDVRDPRSGRSTHLMAQRLGARQTRLLGSRWRVGIWRPVPRSHRTG